VNNCVYCGKTETPLTREHLFPQSLFQLIVKPEVTSHYFSERIPSKFTEGELTVKDVCAKCNNGVLSELDEYQTKWAQKHADKFFFRGESIVMSYEYDTMLRWMLKFAFNSARVHNAADTNLLMRFRGYMLGRAKRPARIRLSTGLIHSFIPTTPEEIAAVGDKPLHPDLMRSSVMMVNFTSKYVFSVRRVSLAAFAFLVVAFEPSAPASELKSLTTLIDREYPGFRVLSPTESTCKLIASFENAVEHLRDYAILQGIPYKTLFHEFQRKRRKI